MVQRTSEVSMQGGLGVRGGTGRGRRDGPKDTPVDDFSWGKAGTHLLASPPHP